jgi:aspartate kinase
MIVMKFGGTSVGSAAAIERVAGIVREHLPRRPAVVVSAMAKTTDKLLRMAHLAVEGKRDEALALHDEVRRFHLDETARLAGANDRGEIDAFIGSHFDELGHLLLGLSYLGELSPRSVDAISSFGERLSSRVVAFGFRAMGIDAEHLDSREVFLTDRRHTCARPLPETYARLARRIPPLLQAGKVVVMGGFIGANEDGVTTTLGRGGSDYTASIVGVAIDAEEVQIWTDVDGILTCDPGLVADTHRINAISFSEAAELAYFGAKVLHPDTMHPAIEKNIVVRILNSMRPSAPGTRVVAETPPCSNPVKAISCKKGITVVTIQSSRMLNAWGFLSRIFEVFERHETSVDMVATSEVSVSVTIDNTSQLAAICRELETFSTVTVERNQAILCVVGDNIRHTPGIGKRIFTALERINVRMVSQGASRVNLSLVVAEEDAKKAAQALHGELFRDLDPAAFT